MRRILGFLTNLVAGILATPGSHPVIDTNTDATSEPGTRRRKPRRPRRR